MAHDVLTGIHHVTAITADAQENLDFYGGVLGLRLVKLTVNFDDPESLHLYYGDETGRPGTILTFFEWPGAPRGRIGPPQAVATAFAVPERAFDVWVRRAAGHATGPPVERMGEPVLRLADPDGLAIEIVGVPGRHDGGGDAVLGVHGVTIAVEGYERTAKTIEDLMGFERAGEEGNRFRYRAGTGDAVAAVDVVCAPDARRGGMGAGVVHHVAFRTPDEARQHAWRDRIAAAGRNVSPVLDRMYFRSIYFREPSGVLFEIATDGPGFAVDEPPERLGTALKLPPSFEPLRATLEERWSHLRLPKA